METVKQSLTVGFMEHVPPTLTREQRLELIDEDLAEFNEWLVNELKTHPMLGVERAMIKTFLCRKLGITR